MENTKKIINIISETLGVSPKELSANSHLKDDLNAEDMEISDLLMKLESTFQTRISKDDAKNIFTVADIIELFK